MATTTQQLTVAGELVTIRPIRASDAAMEGNFVRKLSARTKHYRFFGGVKELSPAQVKLFCEVDGHHSKRIRDFSINSNDDLPEVLSRFEMAESFDAVVEGKDPIDHRFQPVQGDGLIHFCKHRARANVDAANGERLVQDVGDLHLTRDAG